MKNFLAGFIFWKKTKSNVYALQRSEIIDERTCDLCSSMDGRVLAPDDKLVLINSFHEGCRGIWVEIMKDEVNPPPITGVSNELRKKLAIIG